MAQRFDLERLDLLSDAFTVADPFAPPTALSWTFSVSQTGTLAYRVSADNAQASANAELVWYDRKGSRLIVAGVEGEYSGPELSADGKFVAFAKGTPADIWWLDIEKNRQTKLTTDAAADGRFFLQLAPTAVATPGQAGPASAGAPGLTQGITVIVNWAGNHGQ